jgi:hypothetical protein
VFPLEFLMPVQNVRDAIKRFILNKDPQVLCIRGAWGTGKTYTWDEVLRAVVKSSEPPALEDYAYISLFGLNSLQEIKREIFQNTGPLDRLDAKFELKNIKSAEDLKALYTKGKSTPLWFKAMNIFSESAADAAIEATSLLAREQFICIDDLERKGEELRSTDVLGYISHLRDKKDCSVILLLNDEQLEDRQEFESYLEKVVDINLRFEPTFQEIADIAVPERERDTVGNLVRENAVKLGINNVRVIRKILRLVRDIVPMLSEYSPQVTKSATATITLMGWSYLQPELAPSLAYLVSIHNMLWSNEKEETEDEKRWSEILATYGYSHTDEFDLLLLKGVKNGFFVKEEIDKHAVALHNADIREHTRKEMQDLWKYFRDSFNNSETDVLNRFYETAMSNFDNLVVSEMLMVESFLREFDDPRAAQLLDQYLDVHKDKVGAFDLSNFEDYGEKLAPEVRERILAAQYEQKPDWTPNELFLMLEEYSEDIENKAADLTVEQYIAVLKSSEGEELKKIIVALRKNLRVINPNEASVRIMDKAGAALREIGNENRMNRRRAMASGLVQRLEAKEAEATAPPVSRTE